MGNINSKQLDGYSSISIREPEKTNDYWKRIFRYCFSIVGTGSAITAWILILKYINNKSIGGISFIRNPKLLTKPYFNWHILLMSTSFLLLMAPSIITFEVIPMERMQNKNLHYYLNTLSLLLGLLGLAIIVDCNQNLSKKGSFRSVHGITGWITLSFLLINYLKGFILYIKGYGGPKRGSLKPIHKRFGLFTIILGLVNIIIGFMERQTTNKYDQNTNRLIHIIITLILLSLFCIMGCVSKFDDKSDPPQLK